jgi:hypothetical protein
MLQRSGLSAYIPGTRTSQNDYCLDWRKQHRKKKKYRSAVITDYLDSAMTGSAAADHLDSAIAGPAAADRLGSAIAGSAATDSMQRKGLKRKKSGLRVRITTCMNFSARMPCFPTDGRIS